MNDAFLVRVLYCGANVEKQFDSFAGWQIVFVAELCDGQSLDDLHHEIRPAGFRRPSVQHFGDI